MDNDELDIRGLIHDVVHLKSNITNLGTCRVWYYCDDDFLYEEDVVKQVEPEKGWERYYDKFGTQIIAQKIEPLKTDKEVRTFLKWKLKQ